MKESSPPDELEGFMIARDRLRLDHAGKGVSAGLRPLFSAATLGRLIKSEAEYASESFSSAVRQRLLWAQRSPQDQGLYGGIEFLMGGSPIGRQIIKASFVGDYRLFRFTRTRASRDEAGSEQRLHMKTDSLELEFVEERISIFFDHMDEPAFSYWSVEASGSEPEQSGAVFYSIGKLFLAGVARDTMSMAILQVTHMGEPMHGFWTSTLSSGLRAPFSARVLMVQSENETMLAKLRSDERAKTFFDITQGGYAFYQTIA